MKRKREDCVIQLFGQQKIRTRWIAEQSCWYFSVVDVLAALNASTNPNRYWSDWKRKWREVVSDKETFVLTKIVSLKFPAKNGKCHQTDALPAEALRELLGTLLLPKTEAFRSWLKMVKPEVGYQAPTPRDYPILPLLNSPFHPGEAKETAEAFSQEDVRVIATGERYYFTGRAMECKNTVEPYVNSQTIPLCLSASLLYAFANMTLGDGAEINRGLTSMKACVERGLQEDLSPEIKASCVFASHIGAVLLHLPTEGLLPVQDYSRYLPTGTRAFATYLMAHKAYLDGKYELALGLAQAGLASCDQIYPICMIYLYCVIAMCQMNDKQPQEAGATLQKAWNLAEADEFIEPFIEHHGLLQGLIEVSSKKKNPEMYGRIAEGVVAFSRGWMKIHNEAVKDQVTDRLSPMEFSIAMMACRNWTNQEIAKQLGLSVNTVKHYLTKIFSKLGIERREDLKQFVNQ